MTELPKKLVERIEELAKEYSDEVFNLNPNGFSVSKHCNESSLEEAGEAVGEKIAQELYADLAMAMEALEKLTKMNFPKDFKSCKGEEVLEITAGENCNIARETLTTLRKKYNDSKLKTAKKVLKEMDGTPGKYNDQETEGGK